MEEIATVAGAGAVCSQHHLATLLPSRPGFGRLYDCSGPSTMGALSAAQLLPAVVLPLSCTSSRTFYKTVLPSLTQCAHSPAQDGWPALALLATDRSRGGGDTHSSAQDDPFLLSRLTLSGPDFPVWEIQFPHSNCPATKKNQNQMRTLLNAASHTSFFFFMVK